MIQFLDLRAQYLAIQPEIDAAIAAVFASGRFILGEQVAAFEREFAAYCGARHGVGVGSGTEAIHVALLACGIGPGDEVITVPNTAVATVSAIEQTGARAVFVDVDFAARTLDPRKLEAALTPRTRAILPVHLYGAPADLEPILAIARARGVRVVEDCAQAVGALYQGRRVGALGDLGCFSFYPTKNLGAYGDGGFITTNDDALADRLRLLRTYGWRERDKSVIKGLNSRLDELQAAMLRVKLRHLDAWTARRRQLAARFSELLSDSGVSLPIEPAGARPPVAGAAVSGAGGSGPAGARPPVAGAAVSGAGGSGPAGARPVYHLYVIATPERDALRAHLKERGIETLVHYPVPIHLQEAYAGMGCAPGSFPNAERLAREILSLPLYPEMDDASVDTVAAAITDYYS